MVRDEDAVKVVEPASMNEREAAAAHEYLESGQQVGKVVLTIP